jgi:hypothetical protein
MLQSQHSGKFCDGIDPHLPPFNEHMALTDKQEWLMAHPQTSDTLQGKASGPTGVTNANPSFKRASVLFVASFGSFIGASLLLASL